MRAFSQRVFLLGILSLLLAPWAAAQEEFIWTAIGEVDSLARAAPDAIPGWVVEHHWQVGAMVGELLSSAIEVGDVGDHAGEQDNLRLAGLLAAAERNRGGSSALADLVETYATWTSAARLTRAKAKRFEAQAAATEASPAKVAALESALQLYRRIDDRRSEAILWGSLAVAHWYGGDVAIISDCLEKARVARERIEDHVLLGRTLNSLGSLHYQFLGDYLEAEKYYRRAILARERTGDINGLLGSWTYLGNSLRDQQKLHAAAKAYGRASSFARVSDDTVRCVQLLISQAGLMPELGQLTRSTQLYGEALSLAHGLRDQRLQMVCHKNLALNYDECRDYRTARAHLDSARVLLEAQPDPDSEWEIHRNYCKIALAVDELDLADTHNRRALAIARASGRRPAIVESMVNRGALFDRRGEPDSALACAREAERIAAGEGNLRLVREAVVLAAQIESSTRLYDQALAHWRWAATNDSTSQAAGLLAEDRLGIANVLAMRGDAQRARDLYRRQWREVVASGRRDLLEPILFGLGHSFERSQPDSAYWYYERAQAHLEDYRQSLAGDELGTGFFSGEHRQAYEEIALYYAKQARAARPGPWVERAFLAIERSKARGLRDLIARRALFATAPAAEAIVDSLYALGPNADPAVRQQLEATYADIRERSVRDALGRVPVDEVDVGLAEVQHKLPLGTVLLAYALGDTASLCWAIDHAGFDLYNLPGRDAFESRIAILRRDMQTPGLREAELQRVAHELHTLLIAPAASRLAHAERIVVIPDGALHALPFEVLVESMPRPESSWNALSLLIDRYTVTYTPSASIFAQGADIPPQSNAPILIGVCDPDFSRFADGSAWPVLKGGCEPLEMARTASRRGDGSVVILEGDAADEANFKKCAANRHPYILHLGTHGEVDENQPEFSRIVLCPDRGGIEDGYLHTLEIIEHNLAADIVVISACESARGQIGRGEGVIGLSRAFFATGSKVVIGSLWRVSEAATASLMGAFYRGLLRDRHDSIEALHNAKGLLRQDHAFSHPFYWSAFALFGGG